MTVNRLGVRDLVLDGVGHTYRSARSTPVLALEPTDLTIDAGEFVTVVGPSGSGKSTLLELIAGLRPASTGEVRLGGARVLGPGRRRGVAFPQSSPLQPWRTVADNVGFGLLRSEVPRAEHAARVRRELGRMGLAEVADRAVSELSADTQQRVQIARALVVDPDVVLLDEPFDALDAASRENLQDDLRAIWQVTGKTIVLATRSVEEAVLLGTRVIQLGPGQIVSDSHISFWRSNESAAARRADPDARRFASRLAAAS